jgi:hypothetical protein
VGRAVGETGNLLIQHGLAAPVADEQLAALVPAGQTWVLADAAFGCWQLEHLADPVPADGLVRTTQDYRLVDHCAGIDDQLPQPVELRLVPARTTGQRTDAVLLDPADTSNLALLLETHPLADIAELVAGTDHHLLLAAGGLLDELAVGQPLVCVGPGLLYLPTGHQLRPHVPPGARQRIFTPDGEHAVVVLGDRALRFPLSLRRPVWHLWANATPAIADVLPAVETAALRALEPDPPPGLAGSPATAPRPNPSDPTAWRTEALALEAAGSYADAAQLHQRHGDLLRAAHLYERQASQSPPPGGNR